MNRRELMVLLGGAPTAPRSVGAQQKAMPVIGFIQVVDAARTAVDQWRRVIAGMRRRDHAILPRQQIEPWPPGCQSLPGVEKQQRPTLTALDQLEAGAPELNGLGHVAASRWPS
jgi:hypothetical protein